MNRADADRQLKQSQALYRARDYQAALELLDSLPEKYRRTRQVRYARGLCLVRLDRADEAQDIYNGLADDFPPDRLEKLRGRIAELRAAEKAARDAPFKLVKDKTAVPPAPPPPQPVPPVPPPSGGLGLGIDPLLLGAAVLIGAGLIYFLLIKKGGGGDGDQDTESPA